MEPNTLQDLQGIFRKPTDYLPYRRERLPCITVVAHLAVLPKIDALPDS